MLVLGGAVGFMAGLLGIGGGMLLVPFMTLLFPFFGVPAQWVVHAAIATSMTTIIFTSMSSVRAHHAKRAIRWDIVMAMAPGIVLGGLFAGGAVFAHVGGAGLALFFALFVGYSGIHVPGPKSQGRVMPASRHVCRRYRNRVYFVCGRRWWLSPCRHGARQCAGT